MKSALIRLLGWFRELWLGAQPPAPYGQRVCQGAAWRRAFPHASQQDLRNFLAVFVDAFAFRSSSRLNFLPDDSLLAIYRALYPSRWTPDALELETLAQQVERHYEVNLADLWHERLTLGELFAAVYREPELSQRTPMLSDRFPVPSRSTRRVASAAKRPPVELQRNSAESGSGPA